MVQNNSHFIFFQTTNSNIINILNQNGYIYVPMYNMFKRVTKIALLACLMLTLSIVSMRGQSDVIWSQTYGGDQDENFQDIYITSNEGVQVIGFGQSNDGTIKTGKGLYDMIICEMDSDGELNWTSSVGGSNNDLGKSILLSEGKTFIGGLTYSTDLDQKINLGSGDILFGSLDEDDHTLSQSTLLGGNKLDNIVGVQMQQDGSIILVANTNSSDLAQNGVGGGTDIYICRLLPNGIPLWENTIGSNGVDKAGDFKINSNGEIIIVGTTFSDDFLEYKKGIKDGFALCLNSDGQQVWGKRFSNGNYSSFVACDLDRNENILVTGVQGKINDSDFGINGIYNEDIWVIQLNNEGQENWRMLFGGSDNDFATDIVASHDGGMLIVGNTESYDGLVNGNFGNKDAFALKLDASGNRMWSEKYGGSQDDLIQAVAQDKDGHYWLAGQTVSEDNNLSENNGGSDAWILKLEGEQPVLQIDLGDPIEICEGESLELDAELSFCECEYTWSDGVKGAKRIISSIESQTLVLTVIDESGNSASDEIEIIVNQKPNHVLIATPPSCADTQDGKISILLTDHESNSALTFAWGNGESDAALSDLAAGSYALTLTDDKGCTQELSAEIEAPLLIEVLATTETSICNTESGEISLSLSGGTPPFSFDWSNGYQGRINRNLTPGEYTVTITDANNCSVEESYDIRNVNIEIELEFDIVNNNCFEGKEGVIQILNSDKIASFSWNTDSEEAEVSELGAGEYTLNYITTDGCIGEQIFEITEPSLLEGVANPSDNLCFDDRIGTIGLELRGGIPPYEYAWSTGVNTPFLTGLSAGIYEVTISDANGCILIVEQEIFTPSELVVQEVITINESCEDAIDGIISLAVSGGFGDLEYEWNTGESGSSIENLISGVYQVTITDENGCVITDETEIENGNIYPFVQVDQIDPSCHTGNNGHISFNTDTADDVLFYTWSDGADDQERNDLTAGDYEITISSAAGCSIIEEITLIDPALLDVELEYQSVSCFGAEDAELEVNVVGGTSPYSVEVTGENLMTQVQSNFALVENLQAGEYGIVVIDNNGCTQEYSTTIDQPELIFIQETVTDASCFGKIDGQLEVNLAGGNSPYTIEIMGANLMTQLQNNSALVDSLLAGVYILEVSDNNGCAEEVVFEVDQPEQIIIQGIITDASCFGKADATIEAIVSGGVGDIGFAWDNGSNTNIIEGINAADYLLDVTDQNGCIQERIFKVGQPEELVVENTFTQPGTSDDNGSITLTINGGTTPYEVTWDNGAEGSELTDLSGGSYRYTVRDNNDCLLLGSITLETPNSTNQLAPFNGISLYPNPVDDQLQIQAEGNYRDVAITLYNSLGQTVYTSFYPNLNDRSKSISVADLASGIYHVLITNQDHQSSFKVVVSHQ